MIGLVRGPEDGSGPGRLRRHDRARRLDVEEASLAGHVAEIPGMDNFPDRTNRTAGIEPPSAVPSLTMPKIWTNLSCVTTNNRPCGAKPVPVSVLVTSVIAAGGTPVPPPLGSHLQQPSVRAGHREQDLAEIVERPGVRQDVDREQLA